MKEEEEEEEKIKASGFRWMQARQKREKMERRWCVFVLRGRNSDASTA